MTDEEHHTYQIEIQRTAPKYLKPRMLLNWAQIYTKQIKKGGSYNSLKPVVSIWLLTKNVENDRYYHNCYRVINDRDHKKLNDHFAIHLLELKKWRIPQHVNGTLSDKDIWPYFFTHAHKWHELPSIAKTKLMRLVMTQLQHISDEKTQYNRYMARVRYEMDKLTDEEDMRIERELRLKAEQQTKEQTQRAEQEASEKQVALKKVAELEAKLKQLEE